MKKAMTAHLMSQPIIILAAGGNPTAIFPVADRRNRKRYAIIATRYMAAHPRVEQVGFLENNQHLEMSGGEFCGNATRAAAFLISQKIEKRRGIFTVSGFPGKVRYDISAEGVVQCEFLRFPFKKEMRRLSDGINATVVDLGGIVHVVLSSNIPFKATPRLYKDFHQRVVRELKLGNRAAVGVVWQEKCGGNNVKIHPVVRVRGINSFFYETSCGSGTIAALLAGRSRKQDIVQPSGQSIHAELRGQNTLILRSRMSYGK